MFGWLKRSGTMLHTVSTAVHAVETLAGDKPGPEKREAALQLVAAVWPLAERGLGIDVDAPNLLVAVGKAIDVTVEIENLLADIKGQREAKSAVATGQR